MSDFGYVEPNIQLQIYIIFWNAVCRNSDFFCKNFMLSTALNLHHLIFPQPIKLTLVIDKCLKITLFYNFTFRHYYNGVGIADGAEAVGDGDFIPIRLFQKDYLFSGSLWCGEGITTVLILIAYYL